MLLSVTCLPSSFPYCSLSSNCYPAKDFYLYLHGILKEQQARQVLNCQELRLEQFLDLPPKPRAVSFALLCTWGSARSQCADVHRPNVKGKVVSDTICLVSSSVNAHPLTSVGVQVFYLDIHFAFFFLPYFC